MPQNSPAGLLLLFGFIGVMLWIVWLGNRRSRFGGVSEVTTSEQAALAQAARAMYTDPEWRLCNPATPSELDQRVLSLLDSIEADRDDIDARIQDLRGYMKSRTFFDRFKDKQKLSLLYRNVAAALVRGPMTTGRRQLFANWRMVGQLAPSGEGGVSRAPKTWIRPLVNDAGVIQPVAGAPSLQVRKLGRTATSIWAGFAFALTGAIIAAAIRPDPLTVFEWFFGIFVGTLILFRTPLIRIK